MQDPMFVSHMKCLTCNGGVGQWTAWNARSDVCIAHEMVLGESLIVMKSIQKYNVRSKHRTSTWIN
jgi:hypothetical protein